MATKDDPRIRRVCLSAGCPGEVMGRDGRRRPCRHTDRQRFEVVVEGVPRRDGKPGRGRLRRRFKTRLQAVRFLTDLDHDLASGTYVARTGRTVGAWLDEWLKVQQHRVRPSTLASYQNMIDLHVRPTLGAIPLQKLSAPDLDRLYAELLRNGQRKAKRGGGLSPRTVRYIHTILRHALADAVRKGILARNVADLADPPSAKAAKAPAMRTWSARELARFLKCAEEDPLYPAFLLAATTGMRRGEILGLRWSDVHLDTGHLEVQRSLVVVDYKLIEHPPKTDRGRRSVRIPRQTVDVLRDHFERQAERGLTDRVFASDDGGPIHPDAFTARFEALVKRAGVPRIRFHDLRHTYATLALRRNVHPKIVSETLGHSSVSITLDTYSHAIPSMAEDAAQTVADLIFEDGAPSNAHRL
jgi:integrase